MKTRIIKSKNLFFTLGTILGSTFACYSQTDIEAVDFLTDFKDGLFESFPIAAAICYGVAGIIGVVGAVKVYAKIHAGGGQTDVAKEIGLYVFGIVFFCVAAQMAKKFFE